MFLIFQLNVMKGRKYADSQTVMLNEILKDCHILRNMLKFVKNMELNDNEKVNIFIHMFPFLYYAFFKI